MINFCNIVDGIRIVAFYSLSHERAGAAPPVWAIPAEMLGAWTLPYNTDESGRHFPLWAN